MANGESNMSGILVAIVAIVAIAIVIFIAVRAFQTQKQPDTDVNILPDINAPANTSPNY